MRTFIWVAVALALAGCHPRVPVRSNDPASPGTGGSGGLSTIKMRVLAALAAHDYEGARHMVGLAADLSMEEVERLEQMISAAERRLMPFLEGALPHIFRDKAGHFPLDTAAARELIQTTVVEDNFVGIRAGGFRVYQRILETGNQIWVFVFDGTIRDGGCNEVPRTADELLNKR